MMLRVPPCFLLLLWCLASTASATRSEAAHDAVPARCAAQTAPSAALENSDFDFLIGDHVVDLYAWRDAAWTPPRPVRARWNGWYGLDGRAIIDEWLDPGVPGRSEGNRGVNVRLFDPAVAQWQMSWLDTARREVWSLRAERRDGELVMWRQHPEREGWKAVFEVLGDGRWQRIEYLRDDAGTWIPRYRLVARRIPCGSDAPT